MFASIAKVSLLVLAVLALVASTQSATIHAHEAPIMRIKRDHGQGITGPVHTYVKTDKHANFKWGVRHHVGKHYA